jgi:hypothetical protein
VVLAVVCAHLVAQQKSAVPGFADGDWSRYAGDYAGTKYSKLAQINASNVSTLVQAWTFQGVGVQQTPIVVNGVMYASTPSGAVALDGTTGAVIWRYGSIPPAGGGRGGGRGAGGGRGVPPARVVVARRRVAVQVAEAQCRRPCEGGSYKGGSVTLPSRWE